MDYRLTDEPTSAPPAPAPPPEKPKRGPRDRSHLYKKGEGGRQKGARNRVTRVLKELILIAADVTGSDGKGKDGAVGYLSWLARKEPAVFGNLLGKVLPLQLQMSPPPEGTDSKGRYTASELREQLIARGLRVPTLIDVTPEKTLSAQPEQQQDEEEDEDVETE